MTENEQRLLQRLQATFRVEADEHLLSMNTLLLKLEQADATEHRPTLVEALFREAHSLKGAARAVNRLDVEAICGSLEGQLATLKQGKGEISATLINDWSRALAQLGHLLAAESGPARPAEPASARQAQSVTTQPTEPARETIRISTSKLTTLLNQAEELLSLKFTAAQLNLELAHLHQEFGVWKKERVKLVRDLRATRRSRERRKTGISHYDNGKSSLHLDKVLDAVEGDELHLRLLDEKLRRLVKTSAQEKYTLSGMVDGLLDDMKQALMLPLSSLMELFPKLVRDQARDSGKEVELTMEGADLEIDRRILEQLKDPLIHLLRNAIDHGIEAIAVRRQKNKPARGNIVIAASPQDGNKIELSVRDDGGGVSLARVREAAVRLGLLSADAEGSEALLCNLLFESGLSTSPILTDISGRGLGLAIVREKVEKLGGSIVVESSEQGGTCFRLTLPTTLANFRGLLVSAGERQFVLPSSSVERVVRVPTSSIQTVENRETIELDGMTMAFSWLADALDIPRKMANEESRFVQTVVLGTGVRRIAFAVDEIVDEREVLVKQLGPQLQRVRNVAGATVLATGRVVPVLNVSDLLKSAIRQAPARAPDLIPDKTAQRRSLLVVEDSITSRSLLKNILESAGYDATTAVDGIDALTTLRTGHFDLVVSDVEMPRMDGFDLTTRIRQEPKLKNLPVILVTALDSREDRERGIDVGANAYIVKSGFDQSNLLDIVRRLL
ncbi:MAG: hybrid sensor histidine kinase/response regulator [Rhodocyclales bacterium]|nr:hybrid sensor histidine kinase/response regulator [Rhodocyclales bacterium]